MFTITSSHGVLLDEPLILPVPDTASWREAEAIGIDLPMLYDSIRKTPDERIREHADALAFAETLREAKLNPHVAV